MTNKCARTARPYSDCPSPASSVIKSRIAEKGRFEWHSVLGGFYLLIIGRGGESD